MLDNPAAIVWTLWICSIDGVVNKIIHILVENSCTIVFVVLLQSGNRNRFVVDRMTKSKSIL